VQGGTFSFYDREYREWFIKRAFDAANTNVEELIKTGKARKQNAKSLLLAQNKNETSVQRIIGLTIETRPDYLDDEEIAFLRSLGITRIEMGVQAPDEEILKKINRGHGLKEIIDATKRVKDAGLKLTYHLMPGLPGSSPQKDLKMLGQIFSDENYKPDNIKFYPTSVVKFSELEKMHQRGEYQPYTEKALSKLILDFKQKIVPPWLRIQRLIRDLTTNDIVVDAFPSNLRQQIQAEMLAKKITCSCIRCREIKNQTKALTLKLNTIEYRANGGQEYFLEFVDDAYNLYALLRLRIPSSFFEKTKAPFVELEKAAIVRELHVYGGMVEIGKEGGTRTQHQGLGKKLLLEAEKIAKKHNAKKLAVISGIGAREYYKKLGFILEGTYMLKALC
jgi:elongator complex protein 3